MKEKKEKEELKAKELENFRQKIREELQRSEIQKQKHLVNDLYASYANRFKAETEEQTTIAYKEYHNRTNKERMEYLQKMHFQGKSKKFD